MSDHCDHLETQLTAYLAGELSGNERLEVEDHLRECESCRQELSELEEVSVLLRQSLSFRPLPKADLDLAWKEIEATIDCGPSPWQRLKAQFERPMIWGPVLATAAIALVLFLRLDLQKDRHGAPQLVAQAPVEKTLPSEPEKAAGEPAAGPARVCQVESVSGSNFMLLQTAGSRQPLIWILPEKKKEGEKS